MSYLPEINSRTVDDASVEVRSTSDQIKNLEEKQSKLGAGTMATGGVLATIGLITLGAIRTAHVKLFAGGAIIPSILMVTALVAGLAFIISGMMKRYKSATNKAINNDIKTASYNNMINNNRASVINRIKTDQSIKTQANNAVIDSQNTAIRRTNDLILSKANLGSTIAKNMDNIETCKNNIQKLTQNIPDDFSFKSTTDEQFNSSNYELNYVHNMNNDGLMNLETINLVNGPKLGCC